MVACETRARLPLITLDTVIVLTPASAAMSFSVTRTSAPLVVVGADAPVRGVGLPVLTSLTAHSMLSI